MSKKWISVAAAAVITAGLVGCGGSDSGSSSSDNNNNNNNGGTTSVTAVDDYIYNAQAVVTVVENNKTVDYNLTTNVLYKSYDDGKWHGGSSTYSLPAKLQGKVIKGYKLIPVTNTKILTKLSGGSVNCEDDNIFCPLTFMDSNDTTINGQVVKDSDDKELHVELTSVAGASVVTPVTTLIYNMIFNNGYVDNEKVNYQLETNATYREQFNKAIDSNVSDIAPKLGFKNADDMIKADPMKMDPLEAKAAVLMFNAVRNIVKRGNVEKLVIQLQKATGKPRNLKEALATTLYTAVENTDKGSNAYKVLKRVKKLVNTGVKLDDILADIAPAESINNGDISTKTVENSKDIMYLKAVTLNNGSTDKNTTDMYSDGMKLHGLTNVTLDWATENVETNITENKPFNIIVSFKYNKGYVKDDINTSEKVTIVIPAEINASKLKDGSKVEFGGKIIDSDENKVKIYVTSFNKDTAKTLEANASALKIDDKFNGKIINVKDIVENVFTNAIEGNVTNKVINVIDKNKVTKFGVYVEKGVSLKQATFDGNKLKATLPVAQTTIKNSDASYEVYSLLDNGDKWTDFRDGFGVNQAQDYELNVTSKGSSLALKEEGGSDVTTNIKDVNGTTIVFNQDTVHKDQNITFGLGYQAGDKKEKYTTISYYPKGNGLIKKEGAVLNATNSKSTDINDTQSAKFSVTVDSNSTLDNYKNIKDKHPQTVLYYKATDEFGKVSNERNVTLWLNRAPYAELNASKTPITFHVYTAQRDFNVTDSDGKSLAGTNIANGSENIKDVALIFKDYDLATDVNNTGVEFNITNVEFNISGMTFDSNVTGQANFGYDINNKEISIKDGEGNTTKIGFVFTGTNQTGLELNATASTKWKSDTEANITIKFKDRYGAEHTKKIRTVIDNKQ